jgi:ABC-type polysaccharide/polyol phosphate export permease
VFKNCKATWLNINVAFVFAWFDIKLRYRRTRLGLIWMTLTVLIESLVLSLVFSHLFHENFISYYPYVFSGKIAWQLMAGIISESVTTIPASKNYILNHNIPTPVFIVRVCLRNYLIFLHSSLFVFAVCALSYTHFWSYFNLLLIPLLALFVVMTLFPYALIISIIGARFRDVVFLIPYCMQILFYITPIVWKRDLLSSKAAYYCSLNPFAAIIECMRALFLNQWPSQSSILMVLSFGLFGWVLATYVYHRVEHRLCYWML